MPKIIFEIAGKQVSGLQAEAHFVNWALALEQEHNSALLKLCSGGIRNSGDAVRIFQVAAFQNFAGAAAACHKLVEQAGITISRA